MKIAKKLFGSSIKIADKSSAIAYYAAINCFIYCLVLRRVVSNGKRCSR